MTSYPHSAKRSTPATGSSPPTKPATLQRLSVGGRVRIDGHASRRYLQGRTGTIHQIEHQTVTICLDTGTGRFTDGHINCSPRVLHPITNPPRNRMLTPRRPYETTPERK